MSDAVKYRVPSDDEVRAALARLGKLALRRAFYSKLQNPHWVAALAKEGAFTNPPDTEVMPDGMVRSDPWPEIDYLVRMASAVSSDVADALEPIADGNNQWLRRGIMEAALVLAPADAARLVLRIREWPGDELANFRIDPRDVAKVIVNLLEGGQHRKGMQLADAYFRPQPPGEKRRYGMPEPLAGIESYWYAEELPIVAKALGTSRLGTLVGWLKTYQEHSNLSVGEKHYDMSQSWRPLIHRSREHGAHEIGDSLVDAVREALADSTEDSLKSLRRMLEDDQPLLRRIALDALTDAIEGVKDKSALHAQELTPGETELVAAVERVLADESFIEGVYWAEYMPFMRACFSWRAAIDLTPFFDSVRSGPLDLRGERYCQKSDASQEADARREDRGRRWRHMMLTLVGGETLPKDLQEMRAELDADYGVLEVNDQTIDLEIRSGWIGSMSPIDADAMRAMSDKELIGHLLAWHPAPNSWMGSTHEGQGRVLTEVLTTQPGRFVARTEDLKTLRPTYIRAVVRGWKAALEAGKPVPWEAILLMCEWMVGLSDDAKVDSEGHPFDDDPDYRNLKFEGLQLLEAGFAVGSGGRTAGISEVDADRVLAVLEKFAEHPEPTPEHEAEYGGTNMDPLTLSLNTIRPVAIRTLIRLVNRSPETAAASEALAVLEHHIADHDPSLAVAAAIGEGTGRLYDSVRSWLEERVRAIFGETIPTTRYQQVALSTALAIHHVHMALIKLLREPLMLMIQEMPDVEFVTGWRSHNRTFPQLIGDWVVIAMIGGDMDYDDPLAQAWFARADAKVRGEVLGHLGWQITQWSTVPDDVLQGVAGLWDRRIAHVKHHPEEAAELAGIYWLARSEKYEVAWWLPRLEYASSVVANFETHGMIGERLAAASQVDPATTLRVVENILAGVESSSSRGEYDLMEHAVPQVLASALDTSEPSLQRSARDLMNRLGDAGYIALKERVESVRRLQD